MKVLNKLWPARQFEDPPKLHIFCSVRCIHIGPRVCAIRRPQHCGSVRVSGLGRGTEPQRRLILVFASQHGQVFAYAKSRIARAVRERAFDEQSVE